MKIRKAKKTEVATVWKLTRELAEYENDLHVCKVTKDMIAKMFFGKKACGECYFVEDQGTIVGMGKLLTLMNTYSGIPYFFLRDFMVREKYRGKGYGQHFMGFAVKLARQRGYSGIEWNVYGWNESAIAFYKKTGARMPNSIRFRIDAEHPKETAKGKKLAKNPKK
jgi:GNAT superfamily N-acetyltransferase